MVNSFLSREQAVRFCKDYQFLVDQPILNQHGVPGRIERIVIAPADDFNKYVFFQDFHVYGDPAIALSEYRGTLFSVIIIGRAEGGANQFIFKDLPDYLVENDIPYDADLYSTQW